MQDVNTQNNENEVKTPKTPKEKTIFGLKIAGNVLFYLFIAALFLFSIMNINAGSKNKGFPNMFGKGFLSVQTDSMERDDNTATDVPTWADYKIGEINVGDLIYVNKFNGKDASKLKVGDVITFFDASLNKGNGALNTHRIVYISEDKLSVITQGDRIAETVPFDYNDPHGTYNGQLDLSNQIETVSVANIRGVVTGVNRGAGKALDNIQEHWLWYFVLPVLAFLLFEVFMVVRNIMELKGAKQKAELANDKEAMLSEVEAMKEEMRKQLIAELAAEQAKAQAPAEEAPAVVEEVKAEEPVVEESAPVEEAQVAEEAPVEEASIEETVVEETTEDPKAE